MQFKKPYCLDLSAKALHKLPARYHSPRHYRQVIRSPLVNF